MRMVLEAHSARREKRADGALAAEQEMGLRGEGRVMTCAARGSLVEHPACSARNGQAGPRLRTPSRPQPGEGNADAAGAQQERGPGVRQLSERRPAGRHRWQ